MNSGLISRISSTFYCRLANSRSFTVAHCPPSLNRLQRVGHLAKDPSALPFSFPTLRLVRHSGTMCGLKSNGKKPFERLPTKVVPINYDLVIRPDLNAFTFTGSQTIKVNVTEETNEIVLNAAELEIEQVLFKTKSGNEMKPTATQLNETEEVARLTFPSSLPVGEANLSMEFKGILNDKMRGLYRSKYTAPDGKTERYAAVTQFESTDARRAFPCWDEPAHKATFDVTLEVPADRVALSNMPVVSEEKMELELQQGKVDGKRLKFDKTPVMSTYLLAVVVGEYDYVEAKSEDGVLVRVYTPVGKKEQGKFALDVTVKTLPYYRDYFKVAYPLPKMDLIAIADFAAGAMENWGLVTYREVCLLVDPQHTSAIRKQWIALTVAHELAHQWFGNLVTMEWWTHLWLNEGYASFVEFLCVDKLFPSYDIWTQFVTDAYARALELDAINSSHAIEIPVGHPSEVGEIFDDISYNKGASVIRMLHSYLGDEDFRKGMNLYLTKHAYKNTRTEDLWDALEEASKKPVRSVMSTWTQQKGFPLIKVDATQLEGNKRTITFTQEKFCSSGTISQEDKDSQWMVPLSVNTPASLASGKPAALFLLDSKTSQVTLEGVAPNDWVLVNPGAVAVCRIQYSPEMMSLLLPVVKDGTLPPLDRLSVQSDLFALVSAGKASSVELLRVLMAYSDETNYTVWNSIGHALTKMNILLSYTDFQKLFHAFGRRLQQNIYSQLGWSPAPGKEGAESHLQSLLRCLVINQLAQFGDEKVLKEAKQRFDAHVKGTAIIPADLRAPVYRAIAAHGDLESFDKLFDLYRNTDMQEERDRIARSLGATTDPDRIQRVLKFSLSDEVRSQDSIFIIVATSRSSVGCKAAWEFIKENKDQLRKRYEGGHLLDRLFKNTLENFASEQMATELEDFFSSQSISGCDRAAQQAIETVRLNHNWLARDSSHVNKFLQEAE